MPQPPRREGAARAGSPGTTPKLFEPEEVDSYEIGAKTRLFGNTLQLNASLFRYDYKDLQLVYFDTGSSLVANVGDSFKPGGRQIRRLKAHNSKRIPTALHSTGYGPSAKVRPW